MAVKQSELQFWARIIMPMPNMRIIAIIMLLLIMFLLVTVQFAPFLVDYGLDYRPDTHKCQHKIFDFFHDAEKTLEIQGFFVTKKFGKIKIPALLRLS